MSSNTRYAGLSEPSKAKVVFQSIGTDEMSRHQLIEHVQLNKVKLLNKLSVSVIRVFCEMEP